MNEQNLIIGNELYYHEMIAGLAAQSPTVELQLKEILILGTVFNEQSIHEPPEAIETNTAYEGGVMSVYPYYGHYVLLSGYADFLKKQNSGLETVTAKLISKPALKKAKETVNVKAYSQEELARARPYRSSSSERLGQDHHERPRPKYPRAEKTSIWFKNPSKECTIMAEKLDLTDIFHKHVNVSKDATVSVADETFKACLDKAGITEPTYKAVKQLDATIASDFPKVVAEKVLPVFKANKQLETVSAKLPTVGRDSFNLTIDRSAEYTNPQTKEKVTKFGILNLQHDVIGTRKGEYGAIKKLVSEQWAAALK